MRKTFLHSIFFLLPLALLTTNLFAAFTEYTVTTNADSGAGSLRYIITNSVNTNTTDTGVKVNFSAAMDPTITLTSPLPPITRPYATLIWGVRSDNDEEKTITIDGGNAYHIFTIDASGNTDKDVWVGFGNLILTQGKSLGGAGGTSQYGGTGGGGGGFGGAILARNDAGPYADPLRTGTLSVTVNGDGCITPTQITSCNATGGAGGAVTADGTRGGGGGGSILGATGGNGSGNASTGGGGGGGASVNSSYVAGNGGNASGNTAGSAGATGGGAGGDGGEPGGSYAGDVQIGYWYAATGGGGGGYSDSEIAYAGGTGSVYENIGGGGGGGGGAYTSALSDAYGGGPGAGGFGAGGGGGGSAFSGAGADYEYPGPGASGGTYGGNGTDGTKESDGGRGGGGAGLGGGIFFESINSSCYLTGSTGATNPFSGNAATGGAGGNAGQGVGKDVFMRKGQFTLYVDDDWAGDLDLYILDAAASSGAFYLSNNSGSDYTLSGVISGSVDGFVKDGADKITLSATNTFTCVDPPVTSSGYFSINQGTLALSGGANVDSSFTLLNIGSSAGFDISAITPVTLTLNNLAAGSGSTIALGDLGKTLVFGGDNASTTVAAVISGTDGQIQKTGSGTATLSATNTYTGTTTISAGTLELYGTADISASAAIIMEDGSTLGFYLTGDRTFSTSPTLPDGTAGFSVKGSDNVLTFSSQISDPGGGVVAITKSGNRTLYLSNELNDYTGTTTIADNGGFLKVTKIAALGSTPAIVVGSNGLMEFSLASGDDATYSGPISGSGGILKSSTGTLTFTSAATSYTGPSNVSGGTLELKDDGIVVGTVGIGSGAVFDFTAITPATLTIGGLQDYPIGGGTGGTCAATGKGLIVNTGSSSYTFSGVIVGDSSTYLTKQGSGTLSLAGTSTYSGTTTISAGTLQLYGAGDIPNTSNVIIEDGATLGFYLTGDKTFSGTTTLPDGTAGFSVSGSDNVLTFSSQISDPGVGVGAITKSGNRTLYLSNELNNYTGTTTIADNGGTLRIAKIVALGSTPAIVVGSNGLMEFSLASGDDATYSGPISGSGGILKSSTGTLTFNSASTSYTGGTNVSGGKLELKTDGIISSSSPVGIGSSGEFDFSQITPASLTIGGLQDYPIGGGTGGTCTITNKDLTVSMGSSSYTFSGVIDGNSSSTLTTAGTGTLTLRGSNTYSGTTTIGSFSTLKITTTAAVGSGNIVIDAGTLNIASSGTETLGNIISGTGSLYNTGGGTITLTGMNTFGSVGSNSVTITNGSTLIVSSDDNLGVGNIRLENLSTPPVLQIDTSAAGFSTSKNVSMFSWCYINVASSNNAATFSGNISFGSTFSKSGPGNLILSGSNSGSSFVLVEEGKLTATALGSLSGFNSVSVNPGATLEFAGVSGSFTKAITGDGGVLKSGSNTTTLTSGGSFYSGSTTVTGGTLAVTGYLSDSTVAYVQSGATLDISGAMNTTVAGLNDVSGTGGTVNIGTMNFVVNTTDDSTFSGVIAGTTGQLTKGTANKTLTLQGISTYAGTTTITDGTLEFYGAGNLSGATGTISIAAAKTLKFTLSGDKVFPARPIVLAGDAPIISVGSTDASDHKVTLSGVISGAAFSLIKQGTATLVLSGTNTYGSSGTRRLEIQGGTVSVATDANIGSTTNGSMGVTFNDSGSAFPTLAVTAGFTCNRTFRLTAGKTGTIDVASGVTFTTGATGIITETGVLGALVKSGAGTLAVASTISSYTGGTTISGGYLSVPGNVAASGAGYLGNGGIITLNDTSVNPGGLTSSATATIARQINLNAGITNGIYTTDTTGITLSGTITNGTGAGPLYIVGNAADKVVTLAGANSYTGTTFINTAILSLSAVNNISSSTAISMGTSSTLRITGAVTITPPIVLTADGTINTTANAGLSGIISESVGPFGITKTGAGTTLTLTGVNSYTGTTTISEGTLALDTDGALSNSTLVTGTGTAFTISAANGDRTIGDLSGSLTVSLGTRNLTLNNGASTFSGTINGTGGVAKNGAGISTFTGANTYTGATTVTQGTLKISGGEAIPLSGTTTVAVKSGGTFDISGMTTATNLTIAGLQDSEGSGGTVIITDKTLTVNDLGISYVFSGNITAASGGSIEKQNSGTLTLSGTNTYSGTTTIAASGGTLKATKIEALGSSAEIAVGSSGVMEFNLAAAGTFANPITGAGTITKSDVGTLTLSGTNTYSGTTTIAASGGTLKATKIEALGSTPSIAVGSSGVMEFNLAAAGTFANPITGAGTITKSDVGTLTLSGTNTYSGTTTIAASGGTLKATKIEALGSTPSIAVGSSGVMEFNIALADSGTFSPVNGISGAGGLLKSADGTLTLGSTTSTYTGTTTISLGTLKVTKIAALGLTTSVDNSGTMEFNIAAADSGSFSPVNGISGAGGVLKSADGTLTLGSTTSTYTGTTTISLGTLKVTKIAALGSTTSVDNSGTMEFNIALADSGSFSPVNGISGAGGLLKSADGTLTLGSTASNYTGTTTISLGTLKVTKVGALGSTTSVDNSGTMEFNIALADSGTFSPVNGISGAGGLLKSADGTLTLGSTASNYTGTTTISLGTLKVTKVGALGSTTSVDNSGTMEFNIALADSGTFSPVNGISGAGGVLKSADGTLTLGSTTSTYTGTTTISLGTLKVTKIAALGSTTSVDNSGTMEFNIAAADSGSFSPVNGISGAGGVLKSADGTLTLTEANSYTGTTTISGGTVALDTAGALSDSTLVTGSGTLSISAANGNRNVADLAGTVAVTLGARTLTLKSGASSYGGIISGTGGLTKEGAGTSTFTAANDYSGATNISEGTLNLSGAAGNLTNTSSVAIAGGATLKFTLAAADKTLAHPVSLGGSSNIDVSGDNFAAILSQEVSGTSLVKTGTCTLTLSNAANSYTGSTAIAASGGTLKVVSGGSLGTAVSSISVGSSAALEFNLAASESFGRVVTGAGALTKSGAGTTLTLTGANDYSGGTTITAGTLKGDSTSLQGAMHNNAVLEFAQGSDGTYSGVIDGAGTLTKSGSEMLTITGDSSAGFTGPTTISAGTLKVNGSIAQSAVAINAGTTLKGTGGTVGSVTNNGTCAPGASIGTIYVNGAYVQGAGGTLEIELDNLQHTDYLVVTGAPGTATLAGTLLIMPVSGTYNAGDQYRIVNAPGGVFGTFTTVTITNPDVDFDIIYTTPGYVILEVAQNFIGAIASGNPTVMADYISELPKPEDSDLAYVFLNLGQAGTDELNEGLNQLHHAFFNDLVALNYNNQKDVIQSYISQIQDVYTSRLNNQCFFNEKKAHFWLRPMFYVKNQKSFDVLQGWLGYRGSSEGFALGLDYFWKNFGIGVSGTYTYDSLKWDYPATFLAHRKDAHMNSVFLGSYIGGFGKHWFFDASLSGSVNTYTTTRRIRFGFVDRVARGYHSGWGWCGHLGGGLNFSYKQEDKVDAFYFQPYFQMDSYNVSERGFLETRAESVCLDVDPKQSAEFRTLLAMRVLKAFSFSKMCVQPKLTAGWVYEKPLKSKWYRAKFVGQETGFAVTSYHKKQDLFMIAGDLLFGMASDVGPLVSMRFEADFGDKYVGYHADFKIEKSF